MSAILAVFSTPGMASEQYDQVIKDVESAGAGSPEGRLYHVAASKEGGWFVADVWESAELFNQFVQTLMPVLQSDATAATSLSGT